MRQVKVELFVASGAQWTPMGIWHPPPRARDGALGLDGERVSAWSSAATARRDGLVARGFGKDRVMGCTGFEEPRRPGRERGRGRRWGSAGGPTSARPSGRGQRRRGRGRRIRRRRVCADGCRRCRESRQRRAPDGGRAVAPGGAAGGADAATGWQGMQRPEPLANPGVAGVTRGGMRRA